MGSQSRLVAVQAAVVGVLLILVFATLLQPESQSPIEGVAGPSGSQGQPGGGPGGGPGDGQPGGPGGGVPGGPGGGPATAGIPGAPGGPGGVPTGTDGLALTGPGESATPPGGGPADGQEGATRDEGGNGTPSDDQYRDALSRLVFSVK